MRRAITSPVFWSVVLAFQCYWIGLVILPPDVLNQVLIGVRFTLSVAIAVAFGPPSWRAIRSRNVTGTQQLVLGIFITWISVGLLSAWSLVHRALYNEGPSDSSLTGFLLWIVLAGQALHVTAPRTEIGRTMDFADWRPVVLAGLCGGALAAGVLLLHWT